MKILKKSAFFVYSFILFVQLVYAQSKEYKIIRYNYSFENISSEDQIDLLKKDAESLKNVQSVKTIYKRDSGKGLIVIEVLEKINKRENEEGFIVSELKKLIISHQLTPIELIQIDSPGNYNTIYIRDINFVSERVQNAEKIKILNNIY